MDAAPLFASVCPSWLATPLTPWFSVRVSGVRASCIPARVPLTAALVLNREQRASRSAAKTRQPCPAQPRTLPCIYPTPDSAGRAHYQPQTAQGSNICAASGLPPTPRPASLHSLGRPTGAEERRRVERAPRLSICAKASRAGAHYGGAPCGAPQPGPASQAGEEQRRREDGLP